MGDGTSRLTQECRSYNKPMFSDGEPGTSNIILRTDDDSDLGQPFRVVKYSRWYGYRGL